jgi:hypothetical protein
MAANDSKDTPASEPAADEEGLHSIHSLSYHHSFIISFICLFSMHM